MVWTPNEVRLLNGYLCFSLPLGFNLLVFDQCFNLLLSANPASDQSPPPLHGGGGASDHGAMAVFCAVFF